MGLVVAALVVGILVVFVIAFLSDRRDRKAGRELRASGDISRDSWKRRRVTRWRKWQIERQVVPPPERHIDSGDRRH